MRRDKLITVVIPTISGREHWLRRCQQAYFANTESDFELVIVKDSPTWGHAVERGRNMTPGGAYFHFGADDVEPHPGWDVPAIEAVERGYLPAPRILNSDGTLQSCGAGAYEEEDWQVTEFTRVPFVSREQLDAIAPIPDLHYYADNWFSHRGRLAGWLTVVRRDYLLTHHFAPEGRVDQRFAEDGVRYQELIT